VVVVAAAAVVAAVVVAVVVAGPVLQVLPPPDKKKRTRMARQGKTTATKRGEVKPLKQKNSTAEACEPHLLFLE